MNIVLPYRQMRKPRIVTGINWGHAASRGLVACVPLTERAGAPMEWVQRRIATANARWDATPYGPAMATADGIGGVDPSFGDVPAYDTPNDLTAACLLNVHAWSTTTSGDFMWGKNAFESRGWILLNNGVFTNQVGFRVDLSTGSHYAAVTREAVGTGLMLFVGRRTGNLYEFITLTGGSFVQQASTLATAMDTPSGANLSMATTDGNGSVQMLGSWLWNYPVPNALLAEVFAAPWQMLRDERMRHRGIVSTPVSKSMTTLVEAKQGVASSKSTLVEAKQFLSILKVLPASAWGYISKQTSTIVESVGTLAKGITSLVEAKGGASNTFSTLVEAKGPQYFSSWPAELPQRVLLNGFRESMPKTGLRTSIEGFPQTQIQRSKVAVWPLNETIEVTSAQLDVLWTFYEDTLCHGVLSFVCPHPLTQALVRMRFRGGEVPQAVAIGYDTYHVSLPLEVLG